jgi:hypothetical protein
MELQTNMLQEKWAPVLESTDAGVITDAHKRAVTAVLLENQEIALKEQSVAGGSDATGSIDNFDPILISLVRRSTPNLLAFDIAGVQPMKGPTGLIFAMKSNYADGTSSADPAEALFGAPDTSFAGDGAGALTGSAGTGMSTSEGEGSANWGQMGFSIDKTTVTAKSRQLKAHYTMELAQDLKAVHGLSAETELANILSTEILSEINRELIFTMNTNAKTGTDFDATVNVAGVGGGTSDGRWELEVYKSLITHIEKEANGIALDTRRGKGNFAIVSSNVAAALNATGNVAYGNVAGTGLSDITGNLFVGTLNGGIKLYVDPFAASDYITVGYKGSNAYDAGIFYCPYVPLSMHKTVGEDDFQPRIGFKTRYGMADNPFVTAGANNNVYYRNLAVTNL